MSRREVFGAAAGFLGGLAVSQLAVQAFRRGSISAHRHADSAQSHSADEALALLLAGNQRFVEGRSQHPNISRHWRQQQASGQHPFAVILGCSDSRVPVEFVFDAGLGDLFVIREAGNSADEFTQGSIEYAVGHLHVPLVLVLGHEGCGAVGAAVQCVVKGEKEPGHIARVVQAIKPAVQRVREQGYGDDLVSRAVRENVRLVRDQLTASMPLLAGAVAEGKVRFVGAVYDLHRGAVAMV